MAYLGKLEHPMIDQMKVYEEMREELEKTALGSGWSLMTDS